MPHGDSADGSRRPQHTPGAVCSVVLQLLKARSGHGSFRVVLPPGDIEYCSRRNALA